MIKKTATPKTENDVYSDWQNPVQLNVVHALFKLLETNVFGRIFKTLTEKELKFFFSSMTWIIIVFSSRPFDFFFGFCFLFSNLNFVTCYLQPSM